ncbi:MAG: cardiolipin synthase [Lachnospiraceae bacterium]
MNRLLKFFTSRLFLWGFGLLLQITWILSIMFVFSAQYSYVKEAMSIIALFVVLLIVNNQDNPSYKLAWSVIILFLPVFGLTIYFLFGRSKITKKRRERLGLMHERVTKQLPEDSQVLNELASLSRGASKQSGYISKWSQYPIYKDTDTQYFSCGEKMFPYMLESMKSAKKFIFLEYFIVQEGEMLDEILEVLEQKVKEGVEVRFLYDDMGSVMTLPIRYDEKIRSLGIQCARFNPLRPILSVFVNNRDHRKILVVDGKVGFTGGINIADEYINRLKKFGYWKDTGVKLEGEAVNSLTAMFLEMWNYTLKRTEDESYYMPEIKQEDRPLSDGFVQPYGDSPLDHEKVGENVYLNIINRAKDYIYIYTPYLIIDNEMMTALCNAAKSGVDIHIVTPGIPDKLLVFWLTQSYYAQLIQAGVKIHEFTPGFIHAKCFVCDDVIATVGTINMDYRSLYMHFECGVWLFRCKAVTQLKEDALRTLRESKEITLEFCQNRLGIVRWMQGILRMFAPLL